MAMQLIHFPTIEENLWTQFPLPSHTVYSLFLIQFFHLISLILCSQDIGICIPIEYESTQNNAFGTFTRAT